MIHCLLQWTGFIEEKYDFWRQEQLYISYDNKYHTAFEWPHNFYFLFSFFIRIGNIVANNPWKTILISLICAGLCTLGLLEYSVENRGEKNWVSQSSVTLDYKDWIDETSPKKFRQISVMVESSENILTAKGMLAVSIYAPEVY